VGGLLFFDVDLTQAEELDDLAFEGYLEGLRDAGWRGDPRQVRLGYTASSLRYSLGTAADMLPVMIDENYHARIQQTLGCSVEECCDRWAHLWRYLDGLISETRELMDILG